VKFPKKAKKKKPKKMILCPRPNKELDQNE
jgi:hypothetical protein